MAHITENDYQKMAEAVSNDLINGKVPLNESVSKLASSMDMSQEQIKRLCETTNNTTFGKLFQSRDKTAEDRMVEFDVADVDKILSKNIKEASLHRDDDNVVSLYEYRELETQSNEEPSFDKVAFELRPEPKVNTERDKRTIRKTLDHLRHEKIATEYMYSDAMYSLKNQFKRLYKDISFDNFEKAAAAIHQEDSIRPLTELRMYMRLPAVDYDFENLQKTAGYIDDSKIEFKLFADAVSCITKLANITQGINKLENLL